MLKKLWNVLAVLFQFYFNRAETIRPTAPSIIGRPALFAFCGKLIDAVAYLEYSWSVKFALEFKKYNEITKNRFTNRKRYTGTARVEKCSDVFVERSDVTRAC